MSFLLFFISTFIIIYLCYRVFVINKDNALKKMRNSKEVKILIKIGKIDIDKVEYKKIINYLALGNSLIIAIMGTLVMILNEFIDNFYLWIILSTIIGLVLLMPIIIVIYKLIGKILKKEK